MDYFHLATPGFFCRPDMHVRLLDKHANVSCAGAFLGKAQQSIDAQIHIDHLASDTRSHLNYRAVANEKAKIVGEVISGREGISFE